MLVPVQPSPLDLWATEATLAMARDERRQMLAVLNRVAPRSSVAARIAAALSQMGRRSRPPGSATASPWCRRWREGLGVLETAAASPAAAEITALAEEIGKS